MKVTEREVMEESVREVCEGGVEGREVGEEKYESMVVWEGKGKGEDEWVGSKRV